MAIGFRVNWSCEPVRSAEGGVVHLSVVLEEGDFLFVAGEGSEVAGWELAAGMDGEYLERRSGVAGKSDFPLEEDLAFSGVSFGEHELFLVLTDRETGNGMTWREEVYVPVPDETDWSGENLRVIGNGPILRAEGEAELAWDVYPPVVAVLPDSLKAAFSVRRDDETPAEGWMNVETRENGVFCSATLDLEALGAGSYRVATALLDGGEVVASASGDVEVLASWDVWGGNPELTETLVRPIAKVSELRELRNAGGPSGRRAVMAEFWQKRDPTPGTARNEYLEVYLERLDQIERRFSVLNVPGVNTDQGRVYALLGEPDIIDSRPMERSTRPVQVWTYCTPPVEVSFIDYDGCGIYELVTDWEEVRSAYDRRD